jgi:hypothetical protein
MSYFFSNEQNSRKVENEIMTALQIVKRYKKKTGREHYGFCRKRASKKMFIKGSVLAVLRR